MADRLPAEIISLVLGYLHWTSPLHGRLEDLPDLLFDRKSGYRLRKNAVDGKNASLVCRRWNGAARPFLYRHLHFRLEWLAHDVVPDADVGGSIAAFLAANHHWLSLIVRSVTVSLSRSSRQQSNAENQIHNDALRASYGWEISVDTAADILLIGKDPSNLVRPRYSVQYDPLPVTEDGQLRAHDPFSQLWEAVGTLNLERLTIVGTGTLLRTYLAGVYFCKPTRDGLGFEQTRLLSLARQRRASPGTGPPVKHALVTPLLKLLSLSDWDSLLINDGEHTCRPIARRDPTLLSFFRHDVRRMREKPRLPIVRLKALVCISRFADFGAVLGSTDIRLQPWSSRIDRFHFRTLPSDFDPENTVHMSACTSDQWWALDDPSSHEMLAAWSQQGPSRFDVYEFPDTACSRRLWQQFEDLHRDCNDDGACECRCVAGPGRFVRGG